MTFRGRFAATAGALMVAATGLVPVAMVPAAAAASSLFFSEYIEGSSFNKAIEIYNGTGSPVDLVTYSLELYSNGAATPSQTVTLSGSLADGDVYVLAHPSADPAILAVADATSSAVINFNGDDAVVLRNAGAVVDAFGQVGFDPGSEWPGGGQNDTLRRAQDVCAGDTNPDDAFDAGTEWVVFANDTFDGLGSHTANCNGVVTTDVVINEFSASTAGDDVEYVEIYGEPGTDYSAYTVLEIEGDAASNEGTVDEVIAIGATDIDGFYLASLPSNALENGTISLLLVEAFSGAAGDDLDTDDDGVLDTEPWARVVDAVAVFDGGAGDLTYGVPALGPNYDGISSFPPGGASRIPDGTDHDTTADWVRNNFGLAGIVTGVTPAVGEAYNTPGAPNQVYEPPAEACGDPFTPIPAVQGGGATSPLAGTDVAVEGVVVGDFQNNAQPDSGELNGFYLQDPTGDGDAATSDGIFIYSPGGTDVSVGDAVRVRGPVSEFNGVTEITASQIWGCSTGNPLPAPAELSLPVASVDGFESFEGMYVTFPQALVIAEYFNFDRFGEIVLTSSRHLTPTAEVEPGPDAIAAAGAFLLDRITLDDGRTSQNPDPAIHPDGGDFTLANLFRGGDTVTDVTGVMDYAFGLYRIQPTQGAGYANVNPRPAAPGGVGGTLEVASFNVLNYFTTLDNNGAVCGPLANQDCRGADDAEEFTRQRDKIIAALATMSSDVVGLIEIENHPDDDPTADLVAGLNDAVAPADAYDYIATGAIGSDAIRVALIYKPASVTPLGDFAVLNSSVDSRFLDDYNRPVLAQTFIDNASGGVFTVAVNHLKSKGSPCDDVGDPNTGDGSGNCNLTRASAAEALVDWLAGDPTGSGDQDVLIIGDLNSYDKEQPIDAIVAGGYTDLIRHYLGEDAYSYVFDGQVGYLDHALANSDLASEVTGVTIWHINADEPDLLDYDTSFKQDAQDDIYAPDPYRSSDHDPVITGLGVCDEIDPTFDELSVSPDELWPPNHQYVDVTATVVVSDNFDPNPVVRLVGVTSDEPDDARGSGDGRTLEDIVVVDDLHFQLRAERSAQGDGRTYTITYEAMDACGNTTSQSVAVFVPRSRGA